MKFDPNTRVFDRVPDSFVSPFPGADAFADDAFQALLVRARTGGRGTIGEELLAQSSAQAWNHATQIFWKTKATQVGDITGQIWSQISWINEKADSISGVLAQVPFPLTTDPRQLVSAIAGVALDLALNAISAVPVVGWIAGIAVGIGRALAPIFAGMIKENQVVPEARRLVLPWRRYNETVDERWVRTFIEMDAAQVDWTAVFSPPTDPVPWTSADGLDDQGTTIGQVLAPFAGSTVAWNGGYGCLPGTFRVAGILQHRHRPQPPTADLRFYSDGTLIQRHGDYTQTGDYYPCLQQVAGMAWQQIAAGGPDAFKVDCLSLETLWRDWFTALYTSAIDQGLGDWLLPYLARDIQGEWRLGASASGIPRPEAADGTFAPLVTRATLRTGALATARSRTACLYSDITPANAPRAQSGYLPTKWTRDPRTGDFIAPPVDPRAARGRDHTCIPWPPGDLLLAKYARVDDVIAVPAIRAVAKLQRARLARSLDCAYVRPDAVGDKPAYAAFRDPALRQLCLDMRKRLLTHPARMLVEYETAREVDPDYAAALRSAGIPTTPAQRAAAKFKIRAAEAAEPLDERIPPAGDPVEPQGGIPFDPEPEDPQNQSRGRWLGPAILGGAAVAATIAVAVGVTRRRRAAGGVA